MYTHALVIQVAHQDGPKVSYPDGFQQYVHKFAYEYLQALGQADGATCSNSIYQARFCIIDSDHSILFALSNPYPNTLKLMRLLPDETPGDFVSRVTKSYLNNQIF